MTNGSATMIVGAPRHYSHSRLPAATQRIALRLLSGSRAGQIVRWRAPRCVLGSDQAATVRLQAVGMAPVQCIIFRHASGTSIQSRSENTLLNGARFTRQAINPGDHLRLGPLQFEVIADPDASNREAYITPEPCESPLPRAAEDQGFRAATAAPVADEAIVARLDDLERALLRLQSKGDEHTARLKERVAEIAERSLDLPADLVREAQLQSLEEQLREHVLQAARQEETSRQSLLAKLQAENSLRDDQGQLAQASLSRHESELASLQGRLAELVNQAHAWVENSVNQRQFGALEASYDALSQQAVRIGQLEPFERRLDDLSHTTQNLQRLAEEANGWHAAVSELKNDLAKLQAEQLAQMSEPGHNVDSQQSSEQARYEQVVHQVGSLTENYQALQGLLQQSLAWHDAVAELNRQLAQVQRQHSDQMGQLERTLHDEHAVLKDRHELVAEHVARLTDKTDSLEKLTSEVYSWQSVAGELNRAFANLHSQCTSRFERLEASLAQTQDAAQEAAQQACQPNAELSLLQQATMELRVELQALSQQLAQRWDPLSEQIAESNRQTQQLLEERHDWRQQWMQLQAHWPQRCEQIDEQLARLNARLSSLESPHQCDQAASSHASQQIDHRLAELRAEREAFEHEHRQHSHEAGSPSEHSRHITERLAAIQAERESLESDRHQQPEQAVQTAPDDSDVHAVGCHTEQFSQPQACFQPDTQPVDTLNNNPELAEEDAPPEAAGSASSPLGTVQSKQGDDDETVDEYMARLMDRVRGMTVSRSSVSLAPEITTPAAPIELPASPELNYSRDPEPQEPQLPKLTQLPPRVAAPERHADFSAMRDLANLSARTAIDSYARRVAGRAGYSKLLVSIVALAAGFTLTCLAAKGDLLTFIAATASTVAGIVWGLQYLGMVRRQSGATLNVGKPEGAKPDQNSPAGSHDDAVSVASSGETCLPGV